MVEEITYPGGTRVLVWRLDEEAALLLEMCRDEGIPAEDLMDLPPKRQREKAAKRLLLCHAMGKTVTLAHDAQGAPAVEALRMNISITHTMRLVAVALNEDRVIGLDAEPEDRTQVFRVRDKFLNSNEKRFIEPDDLAAHIIAWTAKEAIIKAERNSAIDWTEGISLEPFAVAAGETVLHGRCGDNRYLLTCRPIEGHHVTVAIATDGYLDESDNKAVK